MLRVRLHAAGWDQDLSVERLDAAPAPARDQVLVEVHACGVCHRDCIDRAGRFKFMRLPITPGHEAVGRVVALGPNARRWRVGDRVATLHRDHCGHCDACERGEEELCGRATAVLGLVVDGGYASHLVVPESALYAVPEDLPDAVVAPLHCTHGTAYRGLTRFGPVAPGLRVLVTGANGGVGSAAIQVAHALDAHVTAVVRDPRAAEFVRELGAERVIVAPDSAFHKELRQRADLVLDTVGEPTFNASMRSLRPGGRLVVIGNITAEHARLNLGYTIVNSIEIAGSRGASARHMAELLALYGTRPWRFVEARKVALEEADAAQRAVRAGGQRGRVVLRM